MTAIRSRRSPLVPMLAVIGAVVIALGTQLAATIPARGPVGLSEPLLDAPGPGSDAAAGGGDQIRPSVYDPAAELHRVRADVAFWANRFDAAPRDLVAAVKLADASVQDARLTGDVAAYTRALAAADAALAIQPGYAPAEAARGSVLVALHRFPEARDLARSVLRRLAGDPTALSVLGDASLELGDLSTAAKAYQQLGLVADGAAARVRAGRLAFLRGDVAGALAADGDAVAAASDEGLEGDALAFYDVTLGSAQIAAGDAAGARETFMAGLAVRPELPAGLVGLARLDAFGGDLSGAIGRLDTAIAAIPLPDTLALRAELQSLRSGPGDADAAVADRATIEAIARLAGSAGSVYDRGLALYLSDAGLEPDRAVDLARGELAVRPDVYGYDTLAWALVNAGDATAADAPMRSALAAGTQDARLWYHAGVIAAQLGRAEEARTYLGDALALGPALDPLARARAQAVLGSLR